MLKVILGPIKTCPPIRVCCSEVGWFVPYGAGFGVLRIRTEGLNLPTMRQSLAESDGVDEFKTGAGGHPGG